MQDLIKDINDECFENTNFRKVLETGEHLQIVIMSIPIGGEIGEESHPGTDQILYCLDGKGKVVLENQEDVFERHDMILVRKGVKHNFINTDSKEMKIITIYSPPAHADRLIQKEKM